MKNIACGYVLEKYTELCKILQNNGSLDQIDIYWNRIKKKYYKRPYHNFDHIVSGLNMISSQDVDFDYYEELKLAWILHDIYSGCEKSKIFCAFFAQNLINDIGLDLNDEIVYDLILETQLDLIDDSAIKLFEQDLIHDINFAILGQDWNTFLKYDHNISKEYKFNFRKRIRFFKSAIKMPYIFRTQKFRDEFEDKSRNNIEKILLIHYNDKS